MDLLVIVGDKLLLLRLLLLQHTALGFQIRIQLLGLGILPFKLLLLGNNRLLVQLVLNEQVLILVYNHLEGIRPVQEIGKTGG
ncbi:hypothetical protein D3C85_1436550 [compost metagenome]